MLTTATRRHRRTQLRRALIKFAFSFYIYISCSHPLLPSLFSSLFPSSLHPVSLFFPDGCCLAIAVCGLPPVHVCAVASGGEPARTSRGCHATRRRGLTPLRTANSERRELAWCACGAAVPSSGDTRAPERCVVTRLPPSLPFPTHSQLSSFASLLSSLLSFVPSPLFPHP